jgi:O-antigen/teichoic acid export membrane protein
LFKGLGTIIILWFLSPTIIAFVICQLISNIIYFFILKRSLWRSTPKKDKNIKPKFDITLFLKNWRYAFGIAGISLISTIIFQGDKIIISKFLPLEGLAYYTLAGTIALLPVMIANPIISAIFPQFISLNELKKDEQLISTYHKTCKLIALSVFPISFTVMVFSENILYVWTGSSLVSKEATLVCSILMLGQLLQVITTVPFYFVSAKGKTKLVLINQIISVIIFIPSLIYFVPRYGILGAGISWLVMNILTMPGYMYFVHKTYLPGQFIKWFINDVFLPIVIILPIIILARYILPDTVSKITILLQVLAVWFVTNVTLILVMPDFKKGVFIKFNSILNKYC